MKENTSKKECCKTCISHKGKHHICWDCFCQKTQKETPAKDWEKEFDKRFDNFVFIKELESEALVGDINWRSLKDFIQSLLDQTREQERERLLGLLPKEKEIPSNGRRGYAKRWSEERGFNQAIQEMKNILKNEKE